MKLHVVLVALYPAPGGKAPGGVRAVVQNLVGGLQTYDDLQISVVHCHSDIQESVTVQEGSAVVHFVAMPKRRILPNTLTSIVRVQSLLNQLEPDVVNTHAPHYTVAALWAGYPTVYTIHGVTHREAEVYQATLFDRLRFLLEAACAHYALKRVRHVVAISPYVLEEYQSRSRARFHRIDNPLPDGFFTIPNLEEEDQILYAGTIDERKNVLGLLRALALARHQIPKIRLRIAGRWTSEVYYRKVRGFAVAEALESNVEFLGLQSSEEMLQEYARCAAVVLASRQETAPMAVIEAMAAGKPVVATGVGGVPDLVEDGQSGFVVEPDDVEAFAQRLVGLLTDRGLRRRMGQRARKLAERFRVQTIAAQYRHLYYDLAGENIL